MPQKAIVFDVEWVISQRWHLIQETSNFIEKYSDQYMYFTNTSLSSQRVTDVLEWVSMTHHFTEILSRDTGNKRQNIEYVVDVYGISPQNILFIDDSTDNIEFAAQTGVHTLLFENDWVSLEDKVKSIF